MARRVVEQAGPMVEFGGGIALPVAEPEELCLASSDRCVLGPRAIIDETEPVPAPLEDNGPLEALHAPGHPGWPAMGQPGRPTSEARQEWGSSLDYLVVLLGYAIGIGNVWRFPYLVGKYGGGAFVIPYLICLLTVACPLFILELIWGQASRCSTIDCFSRIGERWTGVAIASVMMIFFVCAYYNMLLAYCILYLVASFRSPLPWTAKAVEEGTVHPPPPNATAAEGYWWNYVLNRYSPDELHEQSGMGAMQGDLVIALAVVWLLVFLALSNGIESSAKAAWITVPLPIILLVIMFFRVVTLEGAGDGIAYYLKFETEHIYNFEVWAIACGQILFSLSPGMGTAVTMSSYTRPGEDVYRIGLIIAFSNSTFSILAGFVVFSILGNMSHKSGICVEDLAASSGAGLAFVALADGIGTFESGANLFSVLFFLMLLSLGLDSTFAWVETLNTVIDDAISARAKAGLTPIPFVPWVKKVPSKERIALGTVLVLFLCGLPFCTRMGFYLLDVVDHFCTVYVLLIVCFFELLMFRFDYGFSRLQRHVLASSKRVLSGYWRFAWLYIAPVMVVGLLLALLVNDLSSKYENYPDGLIAVGYLSMLLPLMSIPLHLLHVLRKKRKQRDASYSYTSRLPGHSQPLDDADLEG